MSLKNHACLLLFKRCFKIQNVLFSVEFFDDGDFGCDDFGGDDNFNDDEQNVNGLSHADKPSTSKGFLIPSKPSTSAQSQFPKTPSIPKRIGTKPIEQVMNSNSF